MAITVASIIPAKLAEDTATTQYTVSAGKLIIDKFTATNTTASAATLRVNIVESGDTAGATNTIVSDKSIAPDETYSLPELVGHVLQEGAFISTNAGTASAITIRASGRLVT